MKSANKIVYLLSVVLGLCVGLGSFVAPRVNAQDLKAELDALDDLPEDDLGGDSSLGGGTPATETPPSTNPVPDAGSLGSAPREIGVGDLDLQGLEQELNFDSFKDGGKVGLEQLQNSPKDVVGGEVSGRVTAINFKQLQDRVRLVVSADRPIDWTRELRSKRRQVVVELRNMEIAREVLKRALDTGEFEGPVALVQAFPAKVAGRDSVKVLFQLRSFVDPTILPTGNDLVIDFPIGGGDTLFRTRNAARVIVPKSYLSANDLKEFKGAPISINVKGAELGDFLNLISRSAGKNFIVSGGIGNDKKITMNLTNVPWDQALSMALFNNGLGYQDLDTVLRVATVAELQAEMDTATLSAQKALSLIPLETRLIPINYADVTVLQTNIANFLTKDRGHSTVEKRTNTLVITDIPEVLEKVDRYVRAVDRQTPQVQIEARIVEASEEFSKERGFGWSVGGAIGTSNAAQLNLGSNTTNTGATGPDNGARLRFANLGGINLVDTFLRYNEDLKVLKTIASPRITVLANETANINQGQSRSVSSLDANGNTVSNQVLIPTRLSVTPQVSTDGFVFMDVEIVRDIFAGATVGGGISVDTRSAKTKLVVEDGKTAVIGGIYQGDTENFEQGIPFLRKIPIFGSLFTNSKTSSRKTNELLIFISPRIVNQDMSRVKGSASLGEGDFSASAVPTAGAR